MCFLAELLEKTPKNHKIKEKMTRTKEKSQKILNESAKPPQWALEWTSEP